jgi:hypothetical protein
MPGPAPSGLVISDLFQYKTILIHKAVDTPCHAGFGSSCCVCSDRIAPPDFITPDAFIDGTALNHDHHDADCKRLC